MHMTCQCICLALSILSMGGGEYGCKKRDLFVKCLTDSWSGKFNLCLPGKSRGKVRE